MATATAPQHSADGGEADAVRRDIARAWRGYYEDTAGALDAASRGHETGRSLDDAGLCARARALQGAVGLHRGDLQGALELAVEAQRGDEVLIRIARLLCDELRETDSIIRSGGEEFIVLMPRTDAGAAIACCERIRSAVNTDMWASAANGLRVTTSVGVATTDAATDLEALIRLADSASTRPSTSAEIGSSARRLLDERGRLLPLRGSSPLSHPGSG